MNKKELFALLDSRPSECSNQPPCGCSVQPVADQYSHSLARFNDTSAMTAATMQQTFAQQQATWGAHLLKLQHDICRVDSPPAS